MLFRQLYDSVSSTYTYLVADGATRKAVLIDTVFEKHDRDAALVRELDLDLVHAIDTHCHADHVTGAWLMKQTFGARIGLAAAYGAANVDVALVHGGEIEFGTYALQIRATPGHTDGCLSLVSTDQRLVFSGDALLVRGAGRTDFQHGSAHTLFRSIREQLFTLPDECMLYPAHDYDGRTVSTIGEEKTHNPRIGGGAREEDFVGYMQNLGLAHPKQLDIAVPANMRSGMPVSGDAPHAVSWGPVVATYAGLWEIAPEWVALHLDALQIIDVRSEIEFDGELGHIPGARLLPLDDLRARVAEVKDDKPIVLVCQTGKRSAMASVILRQAGLKKVANLAGGMVRWREVGDRRDGRRAL